MRMTNHKFLHICVGLSLSISLHIFMLFDFAISQTSKFEKITNSTVIRNFTYNIKTTRNELERKNTIRKVEENFKKDNYLVIIKSLIAQNQIKSPLAKKLNLKGSISLSFDLLAGGVVQNIKVIKKSEHPSLNASAVETIKQISQFPENKDDITIRLTLVY